MVYLLRLAGMYDNTTFKLVPPIHTYEVHGTFDDPSAPVPGFVHVDVEGTQNNDVCYIKLPAPTLHHGQYLTVKETSLMPHGVTIEDFGPTDNAPKAISDVAEQVLEQK